MGGRWNLLKISALLSLIKTFRMRPLLAWSISLDSTFNLWKPMTGKKGTGLKHASELMEESRAGIFKKSMGARNQGGIGLLYRARICRSFNETRYRFSAWRAGTKPYLSYWPVRLHRLAKSIPRNRFLSSINVYKYGLWPARLHRLAELMPWNQFRGPINI
jgi:hypothetical protein